MNPNKEINRILRERKLAFEESSGFDEKEQMDWYYYDLTKSGTSFGIEVCRECTIFFGDWHGHYDTQNEWDEFEQMLNDIFENKVCSLGSYIGNTEPENVQAAMLARREDVSKEYIIEEFGTEKIVRVCFFDTSLNSEYRI